MKIFGLITVQLTNAAVVRRQASFNRIFNGDYSFNEDLSTTEDFDESLLFLETTPLPFDIFQTTGPIIDEIQLWTSGPDYLETTEVPFGAFTTEEILGFDFTTPQPEIDLSTIMTFPTDAPSIFTSGPSFGDFTTLPDLMTLGITAPVTDGLPPIPETTEFIPFETTPPPMIIDFTTPFQQTPTVPEWLFQTTSDFGLPEITEDFTGLPFLTTPQPNLMEDNRISNIPDSNPDTFDQDAFANAIENAIKALENQNSQSPGVETSETDENQTIDDNSVAVLIPVPNKSTTSSPVITSTTTSTSISTTSTSIFSNASTTTTVATTNSSTTTTSTINRSTTIDSTIKTSTTQMSTTSSAVSTTTTSMSSTIGSTTGAWVPSSDTTAVANSIPFTTAEDESMLTDSPKAETNTTVSEVDVDVTTPVDLVIDLSTKNIDVTETPEVSNVTSQATTNTPSATTAEAESGFTISGLAITALFIILL